MAQLYSLVIVLHTIFGLAGLVLFWFPACLQKGGIWHKRLGRYFVLTMTVATATGLLMASMMYLDPIGIQRHPVDLSPEAMALISAQNRNNALFLALLCVLVFTTLQRSMTALRAQNDRQLLRRPSMLFLPVTLGVFGFVVLCIAIRHGVYLFGGFAVVAILLSAVNLHYAFKPRLRPREWVLEHLGNSLGSGIGAHTGFLVFGASRLLREALPGNLMLIPWFLPTVVGIAAIVFWGTRYARLLGYGEHRANRSGAALNARTDGLAQSEIQ